jgi:Tfp pilus assembly protein PilF
VADAGALLAVFGLNRTEDILPLAMESAERAVALDPSLSEAHAALALLHIIYSWNWAASKEHCERAIALTPRSTTARTRYAMVLLTVERRVDEAIEQCKQAVEAESSAADAVEALGWMFLCAGRYEEALASLRRAVDLEPGWNQHRLLGWGYSLAKRHAEEMATLTVAVERSGRHPWSMCALGRELAASGDVGGASVILEELLQRSRSSTGPPWVQPSVIAYLFSALERTNEAFEWLEQAVDHRDPALLFFMHAAGTLLDWEPARTDIQRWKALRARMGLPSDR